MESVFITGGTGSFGQALVKNLLANRFIPEKIIIYSRDEFKQHQMMEHLGHFPGGRLRFVVGDVRDLATLTRTMRGATLVVHAAALKQVPSCEYNPWEAVQTNIDGAWNVVNAALANKVPKVIGLSSDKAVNPVNLYGATKLVNEKLFINANIYGRRETVFSMVRYGNVLASRGSVLQLFQSQAKQGPIKLTNYGMSRFWWTLGMAVDFVKMVMINMKGGEIFVPKLSSTLVMDLAKLIAPHCPIVETGIRPGEKMWETLISPDEIHRTYDLDWAYNVVPENPFFTFYGKWGKKVDGGFAYTSMNCLHPNPEEFLTGLLRRAEDEQ
jgi:UDP-N-acetylglucosamine 4,6-dehydratase/5-epimerase